MGAYMDKEQRENIRKEYNLAGHMEHTGHKLTAYCAVSHHIPKLLHEIDMLSIDRNYWEKRAKALDYNRQEAS